MSIMWRRLAAAAVMMACAACSATAWAQDRREVLRVQVPTRVDQVPAESPVLTVALSAARRSGGGSTTAGDTGSALDVYIWADDGLCAFGASSREPGAGRWVAWHVTGRIVQPAAAEGGQLVELGWQRVGSSSAPTGVDGSMEVVLRPGDVVLLDSVRPASPDRCGTTEARLEASLGTRRSDGVRVISGSSSGRGGMRVIGGRGSAGRGAGSASAGSGSGGAVAGTSVVRRGGGRGQPNRGSSTGSDPSGGFVVGGSGRAIERAEVWFVHTLADGTERAYRQTLSSPRSDVRFEFPPHIARAPAGTFEVRASGILFTQAATGSAAEQLKVSLGRSVVEVQGRYISLERAGGAVTSLDVPSPDAVTSFELPLPPGLDLGGQRFSIRLRVHLR